MRSSRLVWTQNVIDYDYRTTRRLRLEGIGATDARYIIVSPSFLPLLNLGQLDGLTIINHQCPVRSSIKWLTRRIALKPLITSCCRSNEGLCQQGHGDLSVGRDLGKDVVRKETVAALHGTRLLAVGAVEEARAEEVG